MQGEVWTIEWNGSGESAERSRRGSTTAVKSWDHAKQLDNSGFAKYTDKIESRCVE